MIFKPHKVLPWCCCSWGSIEPTPKKEASWFSQSHVRHIMSAAVSACSKPKYRTTGFDRNPPHCSQPQPRLWQWSVTCTAGGWDDGSINDLERRVPESSARLCSPGMAAESPPRASSPPPPRCHTHLNRHQLQISYVTQCPLRLANTSSPDLIFPEIWLMLALPPKKGCQIEGENMISLVRTGREPSTMMQQKCNLLNFHYFWGKAE